MQGLKSVVQPYYSARRVIGASAYDTSMACRTCVQVFAICTHRILEPQSEPALISVYPVLYKLFLDKWDGQTEVVPGLPGSGGAGTPPVIVGRR